MILYDKEDSKNTYFNFLHKKNKVVNGMNRCDNYFIPHRSHIEVDDIINLPVTDNIQPNTKYIYQIPFRFYRIKSLSISQITSLFTSLLSTGNLINDINTGLCMLLFDEHAHSCVLTDELIARIDLSLHLIGIRKRVYLITCNKHNNDKSGRLFKTIYCEHYEAIAKSLRYKHTRCNISQSSKKRFVCLNLRQRIHRYFLLYNLCCLKDFKKQSILSLQPLTLTWLYEQSEYKIFKNEFDKSNNLLSFIKQLPLVTGYDTGDRPCKYKGEHGNAYGDTISEMMYYNKFIFIVTEKDYRYKENFLTVTEKTFKPIRAKMPFIIYGQPGICAHLQGLGYKTFNTVWNEEYDTIHDPIRRGKKIIEVIAQLNKMSKSDFDYTLQKCEEIVIHNYNLMLNRKPLVALTDAINNFYGDTLQCYE